jgi:hypothetical protein
MSFFGEGMVNYFASVIPVCLEQARCYMGKSTTLFLYTTALNFFREEDTEL